MSEGKFKQIMQGMTFSEKMEYLWEYYRWVLLVVFFVAIFAGIVVTGIVNTRGETFYSGVMVNVQIGEDGEAYLTNRLEETFGAPEKETAKLFMTSFQNIDSASDPEATIATAYRVVLMVAAEDYDYVVMDEIAWDYYKNHPIFSSLDEMFPAEVMEQYSERIVRYQPAESAEMPLAIDITDSAFAQKYTSGETKIYIAFPGNTGRTELNNDFLEYLMNAM